MEIFGMTVDVTTIFAVCTLLAIIYIAVQLWQQRGQTPITPDTITAAVARVPATTKQLYDTAVVAARFLEQISKPAAPGEPPTLTNEQKKAQAMAIVRRDYPDAPIGKVDEAVEAAVHAVKSPGAPRVVNIAPGATPPAQG